MRSFVAGVILIPFFLTSCVTGTDVTFDSVPRGADVYLDGQQIGQTPITRRIGNGFWVDPAVRVELEGFVPVSQTLDKEIKGINLAFGILLWIPSLLWVWGPADEQFISLRPMVARPSDSEPAEPDNAFEAQPNGTPAIQTQVMTSIARLLGNGAAVRLGVAGTQTIDGATAEDGDTGYTESAVAEVLIEFASDPLFTLVDRESTAEILNEIEFQLSGLVDDEQLAEYGRLSGASHLLIMDYERQTQGGIVTITDRRRLVQVESGSVLASDTTQIALVWDQSSATFRTVSSTHNGRPVRIEGGRMLPFAE